MTKSFNKTTFAIIVGIQLLIIFAILIQIKIKKSSVLGESANLIKKDNIQGSAYSKYKYYYEPKPNHREIDHPPWKTDYYPVYTTNADTFNDRNDYSASKPQKTFRIMTIGDSFTFGFNVSTEDNWTELLEEELNKKWTCPDVNNYEVINLGVAGYDTAYEVERYRLRGQKYQPDLIVWFVTDLHRVTEEYRKIFKNKGLDETKRLSWEIARKEIWDKYGEKGLLNYQILRFNEFRERYYPTGPLLIISHLDNVEDLGKYNQSKIYYSTTNLVNKKEFLFPDDHFNLKGNKKFMEEVVGDMKSHKLLPCD